jgi:hypothetical protein
MTETRIASTPERPHMMRERGSWLLAFLLGWVALWVALGDPVAVANGTFTFDSDYPNAAAAFELFVRDSWRYPLGENPAFGGVNLFFSDAAPWFALLAKAIHGITGIFISFDTLILVNFVLFSVIAHRWARRLSPDMQGRWLITLLLVFSLIMPVRTLGAQHIALSGYWVLLWAMCCVTPVRGGVPPSTWQRWECVAVATVAFMTHSYLGSMATGFMLVVLVLQRQWRQAVAMLAAPLLALYLFGFFGHEYATIPGAKEFSLDILAFVQTLNWGVVPSLYPIAPSQGDVFVYLGTGTWALIVMCMTGFAWRGLCARRSGAADASQPKSAGRERGVPPPDTLLSDASAPRPSLLSASLYCAAIALALFALALNLRVAGQVWVSLPFVEPFSTLYERFRSPGRFAAPLAYLIMVSMALLWLRLRHRLAPAVWWSGFLLAVALQVADLQAASEEGPLNEPWVMQDTARQRQQVAALLDGQPWSGRVFKDVGYHELENQRLLDRLLVQHGANWFSVVHGARLNADEVRERSLLVRNARSGDVTITRQEAGLECAGSEVRIKMFSVCLLR